MEIQINFRVLPHNEEDCKTVIDKFLNQLETVLDMTRESILIDKMSDEEFQEKINKMQLLKDIINSQDNMIDNYKETVHCYEHLCRIKDNKIKELEERISQ